MSMMRWHRLTAFCAVFLLAYVVFTGLGIELADMRALITNAPATDPDMLMMRQHIYGPPNFAVVSAPDYTASALPPGLDYAAAIDRAAALGHATIPGASLRLVELRSIGGTLAGHVQMDARHLIFDLSSGETLPSADLPPPQPTRDFYAPRAWFKGLHRFSAVGPAATTLNFFAGIALAILIGTGFAYYVRLYRARARLARRSPFWQSGGWWRTLHRWTAIVAVLPIIWLATTGLLLAADNMGGFIHGALDAKPKGPDPFEGDWSSPLRDAELGAMTRTTLAAFRADHPAWPVRVFRLRNFAAYRQGVVVAGDDATTQLVYNAVNGEPMSMHEKGYPDLNFPSGWEWHQRLKQMHRGDILGMSGRWIETFGALGLSYLIISGLIMYGRLLRARRKRKLTGWTW